MASTATTIFTNSVSWESWNDRFISQAIKYHLLDYVQGKEDLLRAPVKPLMADYAPKGPTNYNSKPYQTEHEYESHDQGASEHQTMPPEPEPREVKFSDLTSDGQKSFGMAWAFYHDEMKAYEKQQDLVQKFKGWIAATVSPDYQNTYCKPTESLVEWHKSLKKAAGISKRVEYANAREQYREALKTPNVKDIITWVDSWEQAMTVAMNKEVLATARTWEWFEDFLVAIRGILPTWATAYGINKDSQVEDNTLDYRTVANDLRRIAGQYTRTSKIGKIAKGSLGPTFAGEEYQHAGSDVQKAPERGFEDATERTRGRKTRKRKASDGKVCRACEGFHPTEICYYLFQKKAPAHWIPKPTFQKLVEQNLRDDSTLADEVKRWALRG